MLILESWEFPLGKTTIKEGTCFVDIETKKVPTPKGFKEKLSTGYPMRNRWAAFMIGLAHWVEGEFILDIFYGDEVSLLGEFEMKVEKAKKIIYGATRSFDEMVLKGRFINARDRFLDKPGPWPHVSQKLPFVNERKALKKFNRLPDVASKFVPEFWEAGKTDEVISHCARDVAEMILSYDNGNKVCKAILKTENPHLT